MVQVVRAAELAGKMVSWTQGRCQSEVWAKRRTYVKIDLRRK